MAEKLMTAALAVLESYDTTPEVLLPLVSNAAIERLRAAAHRRCETCAFFRPPCLDHGRKISGWCGKEMHAPPRDLDDTCKRWKEVPV